MRKNIIQKILLLLLLTSPFTSAVIIFSETLAKKIHSSVDTTHTEIGEDDGIANSNDVSFSNPLTGLINNQMRLNFNILRSHSPQKFHFLNLQEIYLGLSTPPPKYFFS